MSSTFSANRGSLLNLNVRYRCGFKPWRFQIRLTEASLMPLVWAMLRVLQCVASAGFSCVVSRTISCTRLAEICGLRPGRGASFSMPDKPCRINPLRQRATVWRFTDNSVAIFRSENPAAANKIIFERWAKRTLTLRARACFSNCCRCSSESLTAAATRIVSTSVKVNTMQPFACSLICDALH